MLIGGGSLLARLKQLIVRFLRRTGLLEIADRMRERGERFRSKRDNAAFCREHPDFSPPPLALMYDVQGEASFRHYWDWGIEAASLLDELIREYQPGAKRVLEWGCGPARVIRHMPGLLPGGTECFGTDYNRDSISWCRLAIKDVMFVENELSPPSRSQESISTLFT